MYKDTCNYVIPSHHNYKLCNKNVISNIDLHLIKEEFIEENRLNWTLVMFYTSN